MSGNQKAPRLEETTGGFLSGTWPLTPTAMQRAAGEEHPPLYPPFSCSYLLCSKFQAGH